MLIAEHPASRLAHPDARLWTPEELHAERAILDTGEQSDLLDDGKRLIDDVAPEPAWIHQTAHMRDVTGNLMALLPICNADHIRPTVRYPRDHVEFMISAVFFQQHAFLIKAETERLIEPCSHLILTLDYEDAP